jgi:predicted RND superfamily exporter protein
VTRLLFWPLEHPWRALGLVLITTILLGWQLPRLQVDTSVESLMEVNDPERAYYDDFLRRFGSDWITMVVIKADDVFTEPVLALVQRLSDTLERLDDVARVDSLTTVRNIRGEGDTLTTEPLVERRIPRDPARLAQIRRDALGNRVMVGSLVSPSGKTTGIVVIANRRPSDRDLDRRLADRVDRLIAAEALPGVTMYQFGIPKTNATLAADITRDMLVFLPLSTLVLLVFLLVQFRMVQGLLIPLVTGLVSVVWGMGLMALLGLPLNVLTVMVPAVLIIIGCTEDVHLLAEYHHLLREGEGKTAAMRTALGLAAWPIVVTTGTTVVGFGSVATSSIPAQIHFGYASALGLTANFVVTMLVLPALVRLLPVPRRLRVHVPEAHG